jgi:MFS family permease
MAFQLFGRLKLTRNIILLGISSLINDIGSEMIMPILPLFILFHGGNGLIIGLIGGVRESIPSILKVLSGYWSDRVGKRKIFVWIGYLIAATFKLLLGFSVNWPQIFSFACLERVGKGLRTAPRDAMVADAMPYARGKGFGIHRTFDTTGAIIGSIIVLILFWLLHFQFKTIIIIAGIIALTTLIPITFLHEKTQQPKIASLKMNFKRLPMSAKQFILVASLFTLSNFSYMFFILKTQKTLVANENSAIMAIWLYVLFNIFYAIFSIPFGMLSDRFGRKKIITFGYFLFTITTFCFALIQTFAGFLILFALYGVVYAIVEVNQRAYIVDLVPEDLKATALGTFYSTIGFVALFASLIAGFVWQLTTPSITFFYASALSLAATLFCFKLRTV